MSQEVFVEHVAGIPKPVQEHDGRPFASNTDMKRHTTILNILRRERGWKRMNLCCCRKCHGEHSERAENEAEHRLSPLVALLTITPQRQ
jgi:hypothetical protein